MYACSIKFTYKSFHTSSGAITVTYRPIYLHLSHSVYKNTYSQRLHRPAQEQRPVYANIDFTHLHCFLQPFLQPHLSSSRQA